MDAREFLEYEMTQVGKQIDACLNGMTEQAYDTKCSPVGMTPREMLEHLGEAYAAFVASSRGEKHSWGSFVIEDKSTANLRKVVGDLRSAAVEAALAADNDENQKHAYDFIVGHDNYHVAQFVLARLIAEPDWDSFSIYS